MRASHVLLLFLLAATTACKKTALFTRILSPQTGITFSNTIIETDSMNPLTEVNVYNGGGVGIGDFNNDGLQDIYFTGNMVANKLYLNRGELKFEDITSTARVSGAHKWCRGVSVVDINNDGKADIYISVAMSPNPKQRENLLYVNQGNTANGIPVFKELAAEYGLNDNTHTAMADFFDYDNDGDLDVYLVVNDHVGNENQNIFKPIIADGSHPSTGRLYRNDWSETLNHGIYKNVSLKAGIKIQGYGHSAIISDINLDGWKDIYVTNDFISNNILYINNRNGTFTDRSKDYFKQTSTFAMGVDMQDLNNDGLLDVVELDMNPQDNFRKKMMLGPNNYQAVENFDRFNFQHQYSRNTVQINQGFSIGENDSIGIPVFSQMGYLCNVAETDWSWTPLVTDFDNDGFRDIIITNGFPKDVTDHDFMVFRSKASLTASPAEILGQVPKVKLRNYAFKNINGIQFENKGMDWGFTEPSFSSGAVYADLDNDGDLDVVVSNINEEAFVYRNNLSPKDDQHYLNIQLEGTEKNTDGFGTWINLYYGNHRQAYEHTPYRGYLSSLSNMVHFGLGSNTVIDSVVVVWPDSRKQVLVQVNADQLLNVLHKNAHLTYVYPQEKIASHALFTEITSAAGIHYTDSQPDYVDFNVQKLLPHKFTEYSPGLASADLDGNGLDDIICGGTSLQPAKLFLQQPNGTFINKELFHAPPPAPPHPYGKFGILTSLDFKDEGLLLFDADSDGDQDLYISSGGFEHDPQSGAYTDRLYLNNGKGDFLQDSTALPGNLTSKFCVRAADYDKDGDLDLFIAGRVEPWTYPRPVSSFIYRNDSNNGKVKFTDVSSSIASGLFNIGLVCDAVFTDFDNDGWIDLILAGEWMPLTFFKNENGTFNNISESSGINNVLGWWNTIAPGDFDNDGDIDYIVGNLGLNSFYKASEKYPVHITAAYFDKNGSYDAFPSVYLPTSQEDTTRREYPVHQWEDVNKQMIGMRAKFANFRSYAGATMDKLLSPEQLEDALRLTANNFSSVLLRNDGARKFSITSLPLPAQVSVLNGIAVNDYNGDGNLDVVINGNDFGTEVSVGRYDALNGLLMKGDGKGAFTCAGILESGIYIPGNGKALVQLRNKEGNLLLAASQHNGPLKLFKLKKKERTINLLPGDVSALINYKNGTAQKRECHFGYSFLSQSGRFLMVNDQAVSVQIINSKGVSRNLLLN